MNIFKRHISPTDGGSSVVIPTLDQLWGHFNLIVENSQWLCLLFFPFRDIIFDLATFL